MLGKWEINVSKNYPQKIATAVGELQETLLGADYESVAYLGSQLVNGTNHAVLAEQTILSGKDTKNAVVMIFNEKPKSLDVSLVSINRIVEGNTGVGGVDVNVSLDIPKEAKEAFDRAIVGFVGSKVEPFAYIGHQITKGTDYIFMAELTPVVQNPVKTLALVIVNSFSGKDEIVKVQKFDNGQGDQTLGYAFTW